MTNSSKEIAPILTMKRVMELTGLTARQIRYYEEHHLILPFRTVGNRRLYSMQHVNELVEINEYLNQGINIAGIKKIFDLKRLEQSFTYKGRRLTESQLRKMILEEYWISS